MSFEYEGITSDRLTTLWPGIQSKISPQQLAQLDKHMESMFADKSGANVADLLDFIQICCEYKAQNFEEYVALIMIATGIELLNDVPISLRPHKSRLVSHVFNCHVELWSNDQDKILTAAESIFKISSNPSNINHIIMAIHSYNQFTFNVSKVLLIVAMNNVSASNNNGQFNLLVSESIYERIARLDVTKDQHDKQTMLEFLSLYQTYQNLFAAANDKGIQKLLALKPKQLTSFDNYLKKIVYNLSNSIRNQEDLNINTTVVHLIQLVLNNIESSGK